MFQVYFYISFESNFILKFKCRLHLNFLVYSHLLILSFYYFVLFFILYIIYLFIYLLLYRDCYTFTSQLIPYFAHCPLKFKIEQCTLQTLKLHAICISESRRYNFWRNDMYSSCDQWQNSHFLISEGKKISSF